MRWLQALAVAMLLLGAGCSLGRDPEPAAPGNQLADGDTLGKIERLPGGTAVPTDVRTLLDVSCTTDILSLRTNRELVTGEMPCDRLLPESIIQRFLGQPVAVRYDDGRIIVENETAGTMELPVESPRLQVSNAAP